MTSVVVFLLCHPPNGCLVLTPCCPADLYKVYFKKASLLSQTFQLGFPWASCSVHAHRLCLCPLLSDQTQVFPLEGWLMETSLGMGKGEVGNTSQETCLSWTKKLCFFVLKITYFSSVLQIFLTHLDPAHISKVLQLFPQGWAWEKFVLSTHFVSEWPHQIIPSAELASLLADLVDMGFNAA